LPDIGQPINVGAESASRLKPAKDSISALTLISGDSEPKKTQIFFVYFVYFVVLYFVVLYFSSISITVRPL
jgi:hypothetical protein